MTGEIRDKYDGLGCSPGLPTSREVSVAGGSRQKFEHGTIFHSGSTGAHFLRGRARAYWSHGGPAGRLGFPTTDVHRLPNGNLRARFEGGVIVCDADDWRRPAALSPTGPRAGTAGRAAREAPPARPRSLGRRR